MSNIIFHPALVVLIFSSCQALLLFDAPKDLNETFSPVKNAIDQIGQEANALYEEVLDDSFLLAVHEKVVVPLVDLEKSMATAYLKYEACKKIFLEESVLKKAKDKIENVIKAKHSGSDRTGFQTPHFFPESVTLLPPNFHPFHDFAGKILNDTHRVLGENFTSPLDNVKKALDNVKEKLGVPDLRKSLAERVESVQNALTNIGERVQSVFQEIKDNSVVLNFNRMIIKPTLKLEKDLIIIYHKFSACRKLVLGGQDFLKGGLPAIDPFKDLKNRNLLFDEIPAKLPIIKKPVTEPSISLPTISPLSKAKNLLPNFLHRGKDESNSNETPETPLDLLNKNPERPIISLPTIPPLSKPKDLLPNWLHGDGEDTSDNNNTPLKPLDLTPVDVLDHHRSSPPPTEESEGLFPHFSKFRPTFRPLFRH